MLKIGSYNDLVVEREVDFGFYLKINDEEVLLPAKYAPENLKTGETITVFVYTDSEDRPVATTLTPKACVGDVAFLRVKETTSFGAFLDWGLEKDLLVPNTEQASSLKTGKSYVVKICLDQVTERVYGSTRITSHCLSPSGDLHEGQKVSLMIYAVTEIGFLAVINNRFSGMLYKNETFKDIAVGDIQEGFISKIREDGKIDLSLKKPGYTSVLNSSEKILNKLNNEDGFLPIHDKSTPEEIKSILGMSKKEFKRSIGGLYKQGKIIITDRGIQLKKD